MRKHFAYCDQPLPVPPGTSPFHIKGEFWRQMADVIAQQDEKTEGGVGRLLERDGIREFATQAFLSSAFYDLLPMPRVVMAIAEARSRDVHELTLRMGQAAVEAQMKGVYARLVTRLTPENFVQRFDQVINHFYDFAPLTLTASDSGPGARLMRRGMPLVVAEWWALVTVPFVQVPLAANGTRGVTVRWRVQPGGLDRGIAVGDVILDVGWAAAASPTS